MKKLDSKNIKAITKKIIVRTLYRHGIFFTHLKEHSLYFFNKQARVSAILKIGETDGREEDKNKSLSWGGSVNELPRCKQRSIITI